MPLTDEQIIRSIGEDLPVGIWVARAPGGEFVYANRTFAEILGQAGRTDVAAGEYAKPYGICTRTGEPYPEDRMPFMLALRSGSTVIVDDIVIHRTDGGRVHIRAQARPVRLESGEISHVVIAFIDISREVEAESRLRLMQRMESIGTLAGGIAHDFNNLLSVVKIVSSTLASQERDRERLEGLASIEQAADSGAKLTRALLGFARRGKNLSARVSVNEVVSGIAGLLQRTMGPNLQIATELTAADEVKGDHSQLEQVVMNLVVNARDAIPAGGLITLRTRDEAGFVVLEVADTGSGIPLALRERVFEPYFTTKAGVGTGLGLATVFGIVASHGGTIEPLDNQPRGTLMRVRLPAAPGAVPAATPAPAPVLRRGSGTILLVDDELLVREETARGLRTLGYDTICTGSGAEAVAILRRTPGRIAAVVLDLIMPGMGGAETYLALRQLEPAVRVLLTTGFAGNEEAQRLLDLGVRGFVPKPYDLETLSEELQKVLSAR